MGAAFAGIIRVPFTSVIMIFELTRDYSIIVPLMISNMVSYFISRRYQPRAIYQALAEQDGIHLPGEETHHPQGRLQVRRAMRVPTEVLQGAMTPTEALSRVGNSQWTAWPVVDARGLIGMITIEDLRSAAGLDPEDTLAGHADLRRIPHVHDDQLLDLALERMGAAGVSVLPVVSRLDVRRLEGIVSLPDVMRVYGFSRSEGKDGGEETS
jgi:CIC family chloride channel protein